MAAAKRTLRILTRRIQALEQEILELLADLDSLTQAVCPGRRQTYGVGVDGAAILLTAAGDNPQRIRSEAAFAALCGDSPFPASSGKTNRHRLNRSGNRQANATLHRIAVMRLRWHEQTQSYAARRTGEGLSKAEILRCLKRFIAREIFHTLLGASTSRHQANRWAGGLTIYTSIKVSPFIGRSRRVCPRPWHQAGPKPQKPPLLLRAAATLSGLPWSPR